MNKISEALKLGDCKVGIMYHMPYPKSGGTTTTKTGCLKVYTDDGLRERFINTF